MLWTKYLALLPLSWLLGACVLDPQHGNYYVIVDEATNQPVRLSPGTTPNITIAGILLVKERKEETGWKQSIHASDALLDAVQGAIRDGLQGANPPIHARIQTSFPVETLCAPPSNSQSTGADPCQLPPRIERSIARGQLESQGLDYSLLVIAVMERFTGETKYTWGGAMGAPAFTTEMKVTVIFKVHAQMYDVRTGEMIAQANASTSASGSYETILKLLPFSTLPNESRNFEAIGRAIGEKLGQMFQVSGNSSR